MEKAITSEVVSFEDFKNEVLNDYKIGRISRECSLLGRKEVLTGKAKFGIFGDGKEVAQVALAKYFQKGDFRSGYYRDQTMMFALGVANVETYFAQLYADTINDPFCGGKNMNSHFSTRFVLENGLRVLVHEDQSTPMAVVNVLYDVGARDEHPDQTGFAHLFEHLMFGGSENIPSFDTPLQKVGGENNAFTTPDLTNYYISVPDRKSVV